MKLIDFNTYSELKTELNEFVVLCRDHNYSPVKDDFEDIIKFLLLYQNGSATLCESYLVEDLYESFSLNEERAMYDNEKNWDSAVGTVNTLGKIAIGTVIGGAIGVGLYMRYLFKKAKLAISVAKEKKIITNRIKNYQKLYNLKVKKWELEGKKGEAPVMKIPAIQ